MRSHKKYNAILLATAVLLGAYSLSQPVFAAPTHSVSPLIIDENARARDILKESVVITNNANRKLTLYTIVNDVTVGLDGGVQDYNGPSQTDRSHSLANWLHISRGVIDLMPGETKTVDFTIQVNLDALPGRYHSRIAFINASNITEAETKVADGPSVIINVNIADETQELLQLKKFASDKVFFSGGLAGLTYTIENIGDTDMVPRGEILIYDRGGKEVGAVPVNAEGVAIAPKSAKEFHAEWDGGGSAGKYKAFLSVEYGTKQRATLNDTVFFFLAPVVKIVIIFLVSLTAVLVGVHFWHKRHQKKRTVPRAAVHDTLPRAHVSQVVRTAPVRIPHKQEGHVMDLRKK